MTYTQPYFLRGSGKPLVFQHGLGASNAQIQELLTELKGVRLLSADVPGHGNHPLDRSATPSFDIYTDEIIRIMDLAGIYRAVVGGLSMGSGIAVNMACRYPERVAGLILLRPAWHLSAIPENLRILLDVADHVENGGRKAFEENATFRQIQNEIPAAAESILGMFDRDQPDSTSVILRAMVRDQPCPAKTPPLITLPALVIGNGDDPLHPWAMAEAWHRLLPNSQLVRVPSRYLDRSAHKEKVNHAIQDFMNYLTIN